MREDVYDAIYGATDQRDKEREMLLQEAADVLRECLDYFEARSDVNWEGDGPNAEMRMSMEVQAVVSKLEARDA